MSNSDSDSDDEPLIKKAAVKIEKLEIKQPQPKIKAEPKDSSSDEDNTPLVKIKGKTTTTTTTTTTQSTPKTPSNNNNNKVKTEKESSIKKRKSESSSSSSESESDDDVPLSKISKKPTPQKKIKKEKKEEESSDEYEHSKPSSSSSKKPAKKVKKESSSEESESESDSDSDDDAKTPKKKGSKDKGKGKEKVKEESKGKGKEKEKETEAKKGKKVKEEEPGYKWWEEKKLPEGKKWKTLEHNGPVFPPPYKPHGVKLLYDGSPFDLTPEQEEIATFFAFHLETDHMKKEAFRDNFWAGFKKFFPKEKQKKLSLEKFDFKPIHAHLKEQQAKRKERTKEEKEVDKKEKEEVDQKYGYAIIDGRREKIGNYRIEPPGLFLGRGDHPKTGTIKERVQPEDVTLNLGKKATIPECPIAGHKWGNIVHNDEVTWLAFWKENVNNGFKYVWFHPSASLKGQSDMKKFQKARTLKLHIEKIRKSYTKDLVDDSRAIRQRATAMWLIDKLALRVGNEKSEDEADTVGCCSLRVEHMNMEENNHITLDFLGKDSMRYFNTVTVDKQVYINLKEFRKTSKGTAKDGDEEIFDELTVTNLNNHLKDLMPGLSAKVFRTYNASITLEKELAKMPSDLKTVEEKILFYNRANREVAILCNHQKSVSKTHGDQLEKINQQLEKLLDEKESLENHYETLTGKKRKQSSSSSSTLVKKENGSSSKKKLEDNDDFEDSKDKKKEKEKDKKKEKDKEKEKEKEKGKKDIKKEDSSDSEDDFEKTPKKKARSLPNEPGKVLDRIEKIEQSIHKWEIKKTEKDELKTVALGTSKINYMDPRITVTWCKKVGVPLAKIFSATLRQKFPWAMDVDDDFEF